MQVNRIIFAALLANLVVSAVAFADVFRTFRAGVRAPFSVVFNCVTKMTASGSGTASHGRVETEVRNLPRCGQANVPHLIYWYTPDKDYVGPDEIFLYSMGIQDRYRVNVVK